MDMEIIINPKDTEDGKAVIQVRLRRMSACVPMSETILVTRSLRLPPVPPLSTSRVVRYSPSRSIRIKSADHLLTSQPTASMFQGVDSYQ